MSWSDSVENIRHMIRTVSKRVTSKKNGGSIYWNTESIDDLLHKQRWSKLMEYIYDVLDTHRCRNAVDWIKVRSKQGHVPLMYIYIRNGVKSTGSRVLCTEEFESWIRIWMMFCFRIVEDTVTCSSVMGLDKSTVTFILICKTMKWLELYETIDEWPSPLEMLSTIEFNNHVSHEPYTEMIDTYTTTTDLRIDDQNNTENDCYSYDFHSDTNTDIDANGEAHSEINCIEQETKLATTCTIKTPSGTLLSMNTNTNMYPPNKASYLSECPLANTMPDTLPLNTKMFDYANPAWIPGFSVSSVGNSVYFKTSDVQTHKACIHNETHFRETQRQVRATLYSQMNTELTSSNKWETWMIVIKKNISGVFVS